jgi:hypothetical protein
MQRIRPALERLTQEMGVAAALASERLKTDGTEIHYELAVDLLVDAQPVAGAPARGACAR